MDKKRAQQKNRLVQRTIDDFASESLGRIKVILVAELMIIVVNLQSRQYGMQ
ncbi:hypothetical protein [Nitrosomonas sp. Is37]|uniref:hypothetical protein n=1 Tax=Nitrosomonas sp. Is37 TaxID=3080535 RepID=UPI00294ADEBB|nr:hypothetical protein [Nitrosomonas sp. Is37]MDV6344740.1 hypothetical protein [Nitrosomonas sp. Is37]